MQDTVIRPALKSDAAALTILADIAGYGLPSRIWSADPRRSPGESVLAYGRKRIRQDEGAFSYRNAFVAETGIEVSGMLLGYREPDQPAPIDDDIPDMIRPLLELEALVPGTWYVNILSVFDEFRGQGIGRRLLGKASELAAESAAAGLSIIVEDDNAGAIRLYESAGYREIAARPFIAFPGSAPAERWILMVKDLAGPQGAESHGR